jgi:hypothetical protein
MATLYNGTTINAHNVGDTIPVGDWNNAAAMLNASNPAGYAYLTSTITATFSSGTTYYIGSTSPINTASMTASFLVGGMTLTNTGTNNCCLIAPVAGYYQVNVQVSGAATSAGYVQVYIAKNQSTVSGGARTYVAATGSNGLVGAAGIIQCAASDAIGIAVVGSAGLTAVGSGATTTYVSASLVSH